jgi:hypothetical protein
VFALGALAGVIGFFIAIGEYSVLNFARRDVLVSFLDGNRIISDFSVLSRRGDFGQRNWWILLRCQCWLLITIVDFVGPSVTERGVSAPGIVKPLDIADNVAAGL